MLAWSPCCTIIQMKKHTFVSHTISKHTWLQAEKRVLEKGNWALTRRCFIGLCLPVKSVKYDNFLKTSDRNRSLTFLDLKRKIEILPNGNLHKAML